MLVKMPDKTTSIPARKSGPRRFGISRKLQVTSASPHSAQLESSTSSPTLPQQMVADPAKQKTTPALHAPCIPGRQAGAQPHEPCKKI